MCTKNIESHDKKMISGRSFSEEEVMTQLRKIQSHGFGDLHIVVKTGLVKEMVVSESHKKTKE